MMRDYGEQLGVAFQLADDLIDIASEADETGKTPGTDLREGVRHPAGAATRCASADPADARLHELLRRRPAHDDALHAEALGLLRGHRAMRAGPRAHPPWRAEAADAARPAARQRRPRRPCWRWSTGVVDRVG